MGMLGRIRYSYLYIMWIELVKVQFSIRAKPEVHRSVGHRDTCCNMNSCIRQIRKCNIEDVLIQITKRRAASANVWEWNATAFIETEIHKLLLSVIWWWCGAALIPVKYCSHLENITNNQPEDGILHFSIRMILQIYFGKLQIRKYIFNISDQPPTGTRRNTNYICGIWPFPFCIEFRWMYRYANGILFNFEAEKLSWSKLNFK